MIHASAPHVYQVMSVRGTLPPPVAKNAPTRVQSSTERRTAIQLLRTPATEFCGYSALMGSINPKDSSSAMIHATVRSGSAQFLPAHVAACTLRPARVCLL